MSTPSPTPAPPRPRFYRRRRFWAWSGLATLAGVLGLAVLGYWLLQTVAGRDVLLAQVVSRLPVDARLSWEKAEGPLAGPLVLHGLEFHWQDYRFSARRAYLDPDIRPLLGRRLRLDRFELEGARLQLAASEEPFELPRWPDVLPAIEMPLAIQADRIIIDGLAVHSGGEPVIDIRRLRGGIDIANGRLHAEHLEVDSDRGRFTVHGDYVPADNYRSDLLATAVLPAPHGHSPARLGLVARGDLARMELGIGGRAPEPLRATLVLDGPREAPRWRLQARSEGLDPALLAGGRPGTDRLRFELEAIGRGGAARLAGSGQYGGEPFVVAPSQVVLEEQVLSVAPLALELYGGQVRLRGTADFTDPEDGRFRFSLNAQGLRLPAQDPAAPAVVLEEARLGVAGSVRRWAVYGQAAVARGADRASAELDVRGDAGGARIHALQARMPTGTLRASGEAAWTPRLAWDLDLRLDGFDPGYFAPGWDGRVDGRLATRGRARADAGFDALFDLQDLGGRLRGRDLAGRGQVRLQGEAGEGELVLALGGSRAQAGGRFGERVDLRAQLQPLRLDDLLPGASGELQGSLHLAGARATPDLAADLHGRGLRWNDWTADSLALQGRLPWRGRDGDLRLQAGGLQAGIAVQHVDLRARGAVEDLQVEAEAVSLELATVSLAGQLQRRGADWRGNVARLRLAPARGHVWTLQAPAAFTVLPAGRWRLEQACLAAVARDAETTEEASICASADWPREGLRLASQRLPLSLVHPWLPRNEGRALVLRGELTLDARLRPQGQRWTGEVHVASPDGGLRLGDRSRRELARYDNFSLDLEFNPQQIQGRLGSGFKGDGYVDATFRTGWEDHSPLTGELYTYVGRLFWLELLSPDLVRPQGVLRGHVSLRGTRGQPALGGQLLLEDFTVELPVLGLSLAEGRGRLDAQPDGSARIEAALRSGEGTLAVDGALSWYGQATPLQLAIRGDSVLIADTAQLHAVANPDLQFSLDGRTMVLRGEVEVPSARIDLERLDQGATVSEDVVVLDPVDPEETPEAPLDLDLALVLGRDVRLSGFGLDGALQGRLQVRARPGREMAATGVLDVSGKYEAYGQELQISRGQMTWSNNPVNDPRIHLRAERRVEDITAGIDVTGRALQPRVEVWSDPALPQSEALSYLVLGRSLEGATRAQAQQISAASAAMSAGTGLLAARLGAKLGLDDAGVTQSRALGGSVVGIGKYLSPRLYVGYGVSLVGSGQVLVLKYLLRKGFDMEIESSTVETRGSINWRREK